MISERICFRIVITMSTFIFVDELCTSESIDLEISIQLLGVDFIFLKKKKQIQLLQYLLTIKWANSTILKFSKARYRITTGTLPYSRHWRFKTNDLVGYWILLNLRNVREWDRVERKKQKPKPIPKKFATALCKAAKLNYKQSVCIKNSSIEEERQKRYKYLNKLLFKRAELHKKKLKSLPSLLLMFVYLHSTMEKHFKNEPICVFFLHRSVRWYDKFVWLCFNIPHY
jgi:hypothetical protein